MDVEKSKRSAKELVEGFIGESRSGGKFKVVEVIQPNRCRITFLDEHQYTGVFIKTAILEGNVKNPFAPTKLGRGYLGVGPYNGVNSQRQHKIWSKMIERCYYEGHPRHSNYEDVTICKEWFNFQNFAHWCTLQKGFKNKYFELDKDFLVEGNRVYGPDTCCFIPQAINSFFLSGKTAHKKDSSLHKGVSRMSGGTFRASVNGRKLGTYPTELQAKLAYINYKKYSLWLLASEYKSELDEKVYNRLMEMCSPKWQDFVVNETTYNDLISTGMAFVWFESLPLTWTGCLEELNKEGKAQDEG